MGPAIDHTASNGTPAGESTQLGCSPPCSAEFERHAALSKNYVNSVYGTGRDIFSFALNPWLGIYL
jgi:hypothetical protein